MTLDLNTETRLALVDEIKRLIPPGEQKRLASAIATAREIEFDSANSELSRLLNKKRDAVERMLGPELRPHGILQISVVAMLDARQVARLSSLFD